MLPPKRIDEIFTSLHDTYCFVAFDMLSGYQQTPLLAEHTPKNAFFTHKGFYIFNLMPFGLCNAQAPLERLMDSIIWNQFGMIWRRTSTIL